MSSRAHSGRCFRGSRRTAKRKAGQADSTYEAHPIRYKVPLALRAFLLAGNANQVRAQHDAFALAIQRYQKHQVLSGGAGPKIVVADDDRRSGAGHP